MNFCEQCGSGSRDKDGFCGGCGKPWPLAKVAGEAKHAASNQVSPLSNLPAAISLAGLPEVGQKKVWAAILFALMLGPFGLLYCTTTGTIVMLIVFFIFNWLFGSASILIVFPICAIWAWRAARELSSPFD